jgi:hypothetical protein
MQTGAYFMSEEAEKAAKWEMVEEYQRMKNEAARIRNKLKKTGDSLEQFGRLLANGVVVFKEQGGRIIGNLPDVGNPDGITVSIPTEHLNAAYVLGLISRLNEVQTRRNELLASLKEIGIEL